MKKISLSNPCIDQNDITEVTSVLRSGMLVQGKYVSALENQFKEVTKTNYSIAVSNGTASMHLALISLGIGEGDEVIVPAFSYIATANVVELVGAKPIFVDIDISTFNINPDEIEQKISSRTKAIIPVHEFGLPCEIEKIIKIARKHNLSIIEDAACAVGSYFKNKHVGTFGDFGSFSLHPRKTITSGEGGTLITSSKIHYERIKLLRNHGAEYEHGKLAFKLAGYNYRLTDIQASLAFSQFKRLENILKIKRELVNVYESNLSDNKNITLPKEPNHCIHSWQTYHILLDKSIDRDDIIAKLNLKGIQSSIGAQCIPAQYFYNNKYQLEYKKDFKNSYLAYTNGLALPLHENLKKSEIKIVSKELNLITQ